MTMPTRDRIAKWLRHLAARLTKQPSRKRWELYSPERQGWRQLVGGLLSNEAPDDEATEPFTGFRNDKHGVRHGRP
jgi:hypothetical protein